MTDFEQAVMVEEMSRIYILCRLLGSQVDRPCKAVERWTVEALNRGVEIRLVFMSTEFFDRSCGAGRSVNNPLSALRKHVSSTINDSGPANLKAAV